MKLSERAKILLFIVDKHTRKPSEERGGIGRFFVPSPDPYFIGGLGGDDFTYISGSGDANVLKSLERKGLIERPRTTMAGDYLYQSTESGRLEVEQFNTDDNGQPIWV